MGAAPRSVLGREVRNSVPVEVTFDLRLKALNECRRCKKIFKEEGIPCEDLSWKGTI